jgi:hypothetical protein
MCAKPAFLSHFPKITLVMVEYQFDKKNMCWLNERWIRFIVHKTLIIKGVEAVSNIIAGVTKQNLTLLG